MRWLPSPGLSLVLALLWLAVNNTLAAGHIVLALLVGIGVPLVVRPMFADQRPLAGAGTARRLRLGLRLALRLLGDIVMANLSVANKVLFAREASLAPALVDIDLRLQSPTAVALLAELVTLTPGTLSADVQTGVGGAGYRLLVHALDAPDPAALASEVRERYENLLLEIMQ